MRYQSSHPWQVNQEDRDVLQVPGGLQVPWDRHSPDLLSFPVAQTKPDNSSEAIFTILKKVFSTLPLSAVTVQWENSPVCLSFLVGLWVLCFLRFQVHPLDPFRPAQRNINPTVSKVGFEKDLNLYSGKALFLLLRYYLTFCPSMPGKPIVPCGERRADKMQCRYVHSVNYTCTTASRLSHLVSFCPTLTTVTSGTLESR